LTNALVGQKVAITSSRPQTTRHTVRGIVHQPHGQLVLVDTPGLHRPRTLLGQRLNSLVRATWSEVDAIGLCVPADAAIGPGDRFIAGELATLATRTPVFGIVTKTDLVTPQRVAEQLAGLAELARALAIPVASGENDYGRRQFRDLFERRAVDVVQPDLRRAGGATECLDIAALANAFGVAYASHGGGAHLHLLAAMPNALYMESGYLPEGRTLVDGCIPLPEGPGFSQPEW
jgi:predicted GTPase